MFSKRKLKSAGHKEKCHERKYGGKTTLDFESRNAATPAGRSLPSFPWTRFPWVRGTGPNTKRKPRGFSLLEIMAVVVVMGLLVGAVAVSVRGQVAKAKSTRVKADLLKIAEALDFFASDQGRYPSTREGLEILAKGDSKMQTKYLQKVPKDPWGNRYDYELDESTNQFLIICFGSDGQDGGNGHAADIYFPEEE